MKRARRLAATLLVVAGVVLQSSAGVAHPELRPPGFVHPENSEGEEDGGRAEVEPWSAEDVTLEEQRRLRRRRGAVIGGLIVYGAGTAVALGGSAPFYDASSDYSFSLVFGGVTAIAVGQIMLAVSVPSTLERRASGNALPDAFAIGGLMASVVGIPFMLSPGAFKPGVLFFGVGATSSFVGGVLGLARKNQVLRATSGGVAFGVAPDWNGDGGGVRLVVRW